MGEYYKNNDIDEEVKLDTDEAKEFYYFKLHDYDNNGKLDGLEINAAMRHNYHKEEGTIDEVFTEDQSTSIITLYLEKDDLNDDGYIDFFEYKKGIEKRKKKSESNN